MSTVYLFQYHRKDFHILADDIYLMEPWVSVILNVELC